MSRRRVLLWAVSGVTLVLIFSAISTQLFLRWTGFVNFQYFNPNTGNYEAYFVLPFYQWWLYAWNCVVDHGSWSYWLILQFAASGVAGFMVPALLVRIWWLQNTGQFLRRPAGLDRRRELLPSNSQANGNARWESPAKASRRFR